MRYATVTAVGLGIACLVGAGPASAQLDTVNTIPCAQEGGVCRMPHPTNVYYGVPGKTNGRPFPQGGTIACNTQTFGDPAPGQRKSCWYAPRLADTRRGGGGSRDDFDGRRGGGGGGGGGYRDPDERSSDRGRDRDYDRPSRRPDDYDAPRRRYRGGPDDD